jgi:hypothetical protein
MRGIRSRDIRHERACADVIDPVSQDVDFGVARGVHVAILCVFGTASESVRGDGVGAVNRMLQAG